jgi:hypothetical protein
VSVDTTNLPPFPQLEARSTVLVVTPSGRRIKYVVAGLRIRKPEISQEYPNSTFMLAGRLVEEIEEYEQQPDRMEGIGD